MTNNKKELAVAALSDGTVIDHIPSNVLFKCVRVLGIEEMSTSVTIGNNLDSDKLGKKGIIKVAGAVFPESTLSRIALLAPNAVVNIISDFEVVEKKRVVLPDTIRGIVRCANPKCITNNEPMATRFDVIDRDDVTLRCCYCGQCVNSRKAIID